MFVQAVQPSACLAAKVALVCVSVPGSLRSDCLNAVIAWHGNHRAGDYIIAVETADELVDLLAVGARGASS